MGRLGQVGARQYFSSTSLLHEREEFTKRVAQSLLKGEAELVPHEFTSWKRLFTHMRHKHGNEGTWACFELLKERNSLHLILQDDGSKIRNEIIDAALDRDTRVETLLQDVPRLAAFSKKWPDFYASFVHSLLQRQAYDQALKWHVVLSRKFPSGPDVLSGLFSNFIADPRPEIQSTLTSMYVFSAERNLYDRIIPVLYDSGNSQLARAWRKQLVRLGDTPSSSRSLPFLDFLSRYYPLIKLTPEESSLVGHRQGTMGEIDSEDMPGLKHLPKRGIYRDSFVAKWFASAWLSVEFAINFVHRIGLQMIGPQSLQALALREANAEGVVARLSQLDRLGLGIAPQTYCKALVFFAKNGEDKLLSRLLHSDVHPDEFDDIETRRMIMVDAVKARDWEREELFQGVEWAVENEANLDQLNTLLRDILLTTKLGKAKVIVDRMRALGVNMTQKNASMLLTRAFWGVGKHPTRWKRKITHKKPDYQLDRAIDITRKVASLNVAIPLRYWESLIYSLGRLGRFEELLQLSLEIIQLFKPPCGGLIPIYRHDIPQNIRPAVDTVEAKLRSGRVGFVPKHESIPKPKEEEPGEDNVEDTQHIPADLPFTHLQHPLHKLFDPRLQRNIIRWGFDQTLTRTPTASALTKGPAMRVSDFDIACGVRILATLRDHGVLIDTQVIRSTIASRIVLGQVPSRRHHSRDIQDVTTEKVKHLVDRAWGSEVLPALPEMSRLVEEQRLGAWKRYPVLFQKTYGEEFTGSEQLDKEF